MLYSGMHAWQQEPAVQQVLAFMTQTKMNMFFNAFIKELLEIGPQGYDENGLGALVKLRAVKDSHGEWWPVIRSAKLDNGGLLLWEDDETYPTPEEAIAACQQELERNLSQYATPLDFSKDNV